MSDTVIINEYLFYEFWHDLHSDPATITEDWPFELHRIGVLHLAEGEIEVFEFAVAGETYLALSGSTLTFYPAAGMSLEDLQAQHEGSAWIAYQDPVDLASSRIGDELIPPAVARRSAIDALAAGVCPSPHVLEGLYLRASGNYLALVEDVAAGTGMIIGTGFEPRVIGSPHASSWRRLAFGVGVMLREGILR